MQIKILRGETAHNENMLTVLSTSSLIQLGYLNFRKKYFIFGPYTPKKTKLGRKISPVKLKEI